MQSAIHVVFFQRITMRSNWSYHLKIEKKQQLILTGCVRVVNMGIRQGGKKKLYYADGLTMGVQDTIDENIATGSHIV